MEAMIRFVDAYRDDHGVEPICRVLEIAPSTYHAHARRRSQPETAPRRVQRDVELMQEIRRVFDENFQVYGVRKVWRQLRREGFDVARCTVARLMKKMALQGVIRGSGCARRLPTRPLRARSIMSTGSSRRHGRTCCGSRTSPTSRLGSASSM